MKYIFEDDPESPISILISKDVSNEYIFAGDWRQIEKNMDNTSIGIIDVSPDNPKTIEAYKNLKELYIGRIIPQPCAEFAAVFMLTSYGYNFIYRGDNARYNNVAAVLQNMLHGGRILYEQSSLERFFKSILAQSGRLCFHNRKSAGKFYKYDCLCDSVSNCNAYKEYISILEKNSKYIKYCPGFWSNAGVQDLYINLCKSICGDKWSNVYREIMLE